MYLPTLIRRTKEIVAGFNKINASSISQITPAAQASVTYGMSEACDVTDGAALIEDGTHMKELSVSFYKVEADSAGTLRMPAVFESPQAAIKALQSEGYTENFETDSDALYGGDLDIRYHPSDFNIDKTIRFNGNCGSDGNPIVYAITSKSGVKGTLIDSTGTCSLRPGTEEKDYEH
jgi:hypothetical protein